MAVTTINSDVHINGSLSSTSMAVPTGAVTDASVVSGAAIDVTKTTHLVVIGTNFGLENDAAPGTSTTYTFTVFQAAGAATVRLFKASLLDTGTQHVDKQFTFNLKKAAAGAESSSTMLSATISLDSGDTDNTATAGTLSVTAVAAGDALIMELVTDDTVTGLHGPFAWAELSIAAN